MGLCCVVYSLAVCLCDSCAMSILYLPLGLELKDGQGAACYKWLGKNLVLYTG